MNSALSKLTIANYKSIYRPQSIDFSKTNKKTVAMYGKNASGKSNIIRALQTIVDIIIHSGDADYELPYHPFHYASNPTTVIPTVFSIEVTNSQHTMEYSFAYNGTSITRETLKLKSENTNKYKTLFLRAGNEMINSSAANYGFGQKLLERTLPKTLLLTKAYEDNNPFAKFIFDAIRHIKFAPMNSVGLEMRVTKILAENADIRRRVSDQMVKYDPGIIGVTTYPTHAPNNLLGSDTTEVGLLQKLMRLNITNVDIARKYNNVVFSEDISNESAGTRTILTTLTILLNAIKHDDMLCMDEFGNYIHPYIVAEISKFYESQNPNKIFFVSTHQLGLYDYIDRTERIIVRKDPELGETIIDQRKASSNNRKLRKDKQEADNNFINNTVLEKMTIEESKLYDELGLL